LEITLSNEYTTDDLDLLKEIVALSEKRLEAQLSAALAADQRALVFAGFLVTSIIALLGGGTALLLKAPADLFLGWTALVTAAVLAASLGLTVFSARPVTWAYPGTSPEIWKGDIAGKKGEAARLAERAADCENKIVENERHMSTNGRRLSRALALTAISLCIGGALFAACLFCRMTT
jgi:hypothetical protein